MKTRIVIVSPSFIKIQKSSAMKSKKKIFKKNTLIFSQTTWQTIRDANQFYAKRMAV
jgi:hypothetical protein